MKKVIKLVIVMVLAATLLTGCDFSSDVTSGISSVTGYSEYEIQQRLDEVKYHMAQLTNNVFYDLERYAQEDYQIASQVVDMTEVEERLAYYIEQLQEDEEFMYSLGTSYESIVQTYTMALERALAIQEDIQNNPPQPHVHMEYLEEIDIFEMYRSRFATLIDRLSGN